jgi:hypothetical protein
MKTKIKLLILSAIGSLAIFCAVISGCADSTNPPEEPVYIANPNVTTFDSIGVDEDSITTSYTALDLLTGRTLVGTDGARDCSINDRINDGKDFFLQNGESLNSSLVAGYEIRFFQVSADMNVVTFDSLSKVQGYVSFTPLDFTQNGTDNWGYFNAPMSLGSSAPVFCFWLKGKKDAGVTTKNIYGIIQPREATDRDPANTYGFRMSFRVRINTNGENDFRKKIIQQ